MISNDKLPSRKETLGKLKALVEGTLKPEEVNDWACPWIINGPYESIDFVVWEALGSLCGADLKTSATSYLHSHEDFLHWLTDFQKGCALNPEK